MSTVIVAGSTPRRRRWDAARLIPDANDFDLGHGYLTWIALPGPERRILRWIRERDASRATGP